jgi:ATP-binding cassette subfamily F protein 2
MDSYMYVILMIYNFQDYIARFGHGSAKLAKQAQSKEKVLAKMVASGLTEKVVTDKVCIYTCRYHVGGFIAGFS